MMFLHQGVRRDGHVGSPERPVPLARACGEQLELLVLVGEMGLDLQRLMQHRFSVLVRRLGTLVGSLRLDVLTHDDDGKQNQLEERLSDPGDDDEALPLLRASGKLTNAMSVKS
jgi:hypothetical protein